ncbi:dihydroneopterin aldolase [Alkalicaulis satelles]|uniref:7,8-dihydroneopterin aldolase n=1 Tax=Alkalicaulis satelles TaxID=2609175 RepID=A0A5M6ZLT4_9PROT|nr:dihydroneopterin aldolase [Alkalicaulis satelles]KAA5804885.1 dihydroneopterin aldolase [Alkalicaulis satelles]
MKLEPVRPGAAPAARPAHAGERTSVRVRGLRLEAEVGVYDSERGRRQPVRIDLTAEVDASAASPSGRLAEAVNYAALAETVRQIVLSRHHDLLEDLAQLIADTLFADPRITRLNLEIDKLTALDDADSVGVTLERWR